MFVKVGEAGEARAAWCDGIQKMVQSKHRRECAGQFVRQWEEVMIEMSDSQHWLGNISLVGGLAWRGEERSDISSPDHPDYTLSPGGTGISGKSSTSHSQLTFLTK